MQKAALAQPCAHTKRTRSTVPSLACALSERTTSPWRPTASCAAWNLSSSTCTSIMAAAAAAAAAAGAAAGVGRGAGEQADRPQLAAAAAAAGSCQRPAEAALRQPGAAAIAAVAARACHLRCRSWAGDQGGPRPWFSSMRRLQEVWPHLRAGDATSNADNGRRAADRAGLHVAGECMGTGGAASSPCRPAGANSLSIEPRFACHGLGRSHRLCALLATR